MGIAVCKGPEGSSVGQRMPVEQAAFPPEYSRSASKHLPSLKLKSTVCLQGTLEK